MKHGIQIQKDWKQIDLVDEQCEQILSLVGAMNKSLQPRSVLRRQVKGKPTALLQSASWLKPATASFQAEIKH